MILIMYTIRQISVDPAKRDLKVEGDLLPQLWSGFTNLMLLALVYNYTKLNMLKVAADPMYNQRQKALQVSEEILTLLRNYTPESQNQPAKPQPRKTQLQVASPDQTQPQQPSEEPTQSIDQAMAQLLTWKKQSCFPDNCDMFIYEVNLEDIKSYIYSQIQPFSNCYDNGKESTFAMGKINMALMNFIITSLVRTDIIWKITEQKLKNVTNLVVSHLQLPATTENSAPYTTVLLFVAITFADISFSL